MAVSLNFEMEGSAANLAAKISVGWKKSVSYEKMFSHSALSAYIHLQREGIIQNSIAYENSKIG